VQLLQIFQHIQFPTLSQLRILLRKVNKAIPNIGFNTFFPSSQVTHSTTPTKNDESAVNSYVGQVPQPPPYTAPSCSMVRPHVLRYVWPLLAFLALFQGRSPCDFASDAPQASSPQRVRKRTRRERTLVDPGGPAESEICGVPKSWGYPQIIPIYDWIYTGKLTPSTSKDLENLGFPGCT